MIKLYSIYNKTLKQYYSPIMEHDTTDMKKTMFEVVNDKRENYINLAPANYCVYEVGIFDVMTGKLDAYRKPFVVIECAELVQQEKSNG